VLARLLPLRGRSAPRMAPRRVALIVLLAASSLAVASIVIAVLEAQFGVPDASAVYIVSVVAVATVFGTTPAALTAIAAFFLYDFFFTQPFFTLLVTDSVEWVNLVLFVLIALALIAAGTALAAAERKTRRRRASAAG